MDLVTQLQAEVNNLGMLFYDSVGTLQAQAPPVSIAGEDVVPPGALGGGTSTTGRAAEPDTPPKFNVQDTSQTFASRLMEGFRRVETLAAKLPAVPRGPSGEAEQMERIRVLQAQDAALGTELKALVAVTEARLEQVQQVFAALAQFQLEQRQERPV